MLQVLGHAVHFSLSTVRLLKIRAGQKRSLPLRGNALLKKADRQFQQFVRQNLPRRALGRGFRSGVRRAPALVASRERSLHGIFAACGGEKRSIDMEFLELEGLET